MYRESTPFVDFSGIRLSFASTSQATYIANSNGGIERFTQGQVTKVPVPSLSLSGTTSVLAAPDGGIWFTNVFPPSVDEIAASGEVVVHPTSSVPGGLARGPEGDVWFTLSQSGSVGRIDQQGACQEFSVPTPSHAVPGTSGFPAPSQIVLGPDNALWFTDPGDERIGRVTAAGEVTEFPFPVPRTTFVVPGQIVSEGGQLVFSYVALERGGPATGVTGLGAVDPAGVPTLPPVEVSRAQLLGLLRRALLANAGAMGIGKLLASGGATIRFDAPEDGRLSVQWLASRPRRVLATGSRMFADADAGTLKVKLTAVGARLLKRARRVAFAVTGTFAASEGPRVMVTRRVVARR